MDDAYPLGITDVTPLISKLRASDAQMVFPVSYLNDSLLIIRTMAQQQVNLPAIGGAAGYVIPDFVKGLGELSDGVLSISPANYDSTPQLTDRFRKRFGYFMVHEALEHAVCLGVLAEALETAGKADPGLLREVLHRDTFTKGWSAAMTPTGVKFDQTGLNTMASPVMVQWQKGELATVWPKNLAKAPARWKGKSV
jgi:branched-chain amino acid transport system substrate-binding protein